MGSDIDRKNCFIFYLQKKKEKKLQLWKKVIRVGELNPYRPRESRTINL